MNALPLRPLALLTAVASALALLSCGNDSEPAPASYKGDSSLKPEQVVREYVESIDERDGKRFCKLVAPWISGRWDLYYRDPEVRRPGLPNDCPSIVSAYIGYVEDCGTPREFKGVELLSVNAAEDRGELRLVRARIRLHEQETCRLENRRITTAREEHIWLAHIDGAWRVAKLGELAHRAGLAILRFPSEPKVADDERPNDPPDVTAEQRAYAAATEALERRVAARATSYTPPGDPIACSGGMSMTDRHDDVEVNQPPEGDEADGAAAIDLVGADFVTREGGVCVRWRFAHDLDPPFDLSYVHYARSSGGELSFRVQVREDGAARATSGMESHSHPQVVPAELGADRRSFSVVLSRESFESSPFFPGQPNVLSEPFAVAASAHRKLDADSAGGDTIGTFRYARYAYPDAAPVFPRGAPPE